MADYLGPLTSDSVPLEMLYTEITDSVERHNEIMRQYMTLLCGAPTQKRTKHIRTRSMQFEDSGSDTTVANRQHVDRGSIDLEDPVRKILRAGITARAWEEGISSDEVREHYAEAVDADKRLITEKVFKTGLTDGGWYDATMTVAPPSYAMNTFQTTHDHYLAYNVSGTPTIDAIVDAKHHITEHGYDKNLVLFLNNDEIANIEKLAEWASPSGDMSSPVIQSLQKFGFTPSFEASGVPIVADDWVPSGYGLMWCLSFKPFTWRITDNSVTANMLAFEKDATAQYKWEGDFVRWISCTVTAPGAGVAMYFNSGTWTDPTFNV